MVAAAPPPVPRSTSMATSADFRCSAARGAASSCGSPFSTLSQVKGRSADYLVLPNGRRMHPQDIARESFHAATWIRQLQVVQHGPGRLELLVVPQRPPLSEEIAAIPAALKDFIGDLPFDVTLVERIERAADSKFQVYRTMNEP